MTDDPEFDISFSRRTPPGDDHERSVCDRCGYVEYKNPLIVVGSVATWEDKILLCRRAIEPRLGFWTLPAGYMELRESVEAAARREAWEEARARLALDRVLAVYTIERISQVQIMFRARLEAPDIAPGPESQDVGLFAWDDIPWADIAFPTVGWALRQYWQTREQTDFPPFSNPEDGL